MAEDRDPPVRADVTIRDVARAANVHISTVSRALDPEKRDLIAATTRDRVVAAAKDLGYRPHLVASGLRRGQTRTIGVIVPDLGNPIFAPFARGVTHALDRGGYMPLVADTEDDHERLSRILHHLAARRVEAIVVTAARIGDEELLLEVAGHGVPIITAIRNVPASGLPSVSHDDGLGGRLAAEHLLELGHVRLGQIRGPLDVEPFRARSEGFSAAIAGRVESFVDPEPADRPTVDEGRRLAAEIIGSAGPRPTGLFVQNDVLALGALEVLGEHGLRCPQDVSIVSYNDAAFTSHTDPPLTTVRLGIYELGRQAGALALKAIEEPDGDLSADGVPPELIVRSSTALPGSAQG